MSSDKQGGLNGAYYGPSIPPKKDSYQSIGRGGGPLGCCCSCIFGLVFKLIFTAVVFMGLAFFIFWLIVKPNAVKFHVTGAKLTQFNFSTADSNLHYNLSLDLTIRNPNKKLGIYYDRIETRANYEGQRLSTIYLTPFYQGHKTTNVLNPVFNGQQLLVGSDPQSEFQKQTTAGVYEIEMKLYLRIRFKFGRIKTGKFKPRIDCDLKVPMTANGKSVGTFETKRCKVDYFKAI